MKAGDSLRSKFGGNMRESVGTRPPTSSSTGQDPPVPSTRRDAPSLKRALLIPIDRIVPDPGQPRREFDQESLVELAESLKSRGQLQPVRVRWDEAGGCWVLITGERRWRAAKLAGLAALQAVEVEGEPTASETLEDQLVENALRQNLAPVEQARAFKILMDTLGLSHRQLAEKLHIAHSAVTQALALLKLPVEVQESVEVGDLAPSAAYEVAKLEDPVEQVALAEQVVKEKLTRSDVVAAVREKKASKTPAIKTGVSIPKVVSTNPPALSKSKSATGVTQVDIILSLGHKVSISGVPANASPTALLEILYQAVDKLKAEIAATA